MEGEAREVAIVHAGIAKEIRATGNPVRTPACVLSGGETTVTLRGKGKGGRNQEFVLAAVIALGGQPGTVILSAGTDGSDGPTDAAGAVAMRVDPAVAAHYLARNDSYHYFAKYGGLIKTGPTGTNVMDVRVVLVR
jgi:hydroxypyruvate reductase